MTLSLYDIAKEVLNENTITPPEIPNTKNFWHGGNLDEYDEVIAQKNGRYQYGAGLYLITKYDIAKRYSKGSRKLYIISVELGNDITDSTIPEENVHQFIHTYVIKNFRKELIERLKRFTDNGMVNADVFNNIILNNKAVKGTNTSKLRQFFIDNNIDYEIVNNAFGFGEEMMVLYNMKKVVNIIQVKSTDRMEIYDL
jgi:hypothetical protein